MEDLVRANPTADEPGARAPEAVRPGGLHGAAGTHLKETQEGLDELMRQMLDSAGFTEDQLQSIDKSRNAKKKKDSGRPMELRQWYRWAIIEAEKTDPEQAAHMRATLANFDALAQREMTEALAYADWLQNFSGVPLSPNIDREALAADLWAEVEELMAPISDFSEGIPKVKDPEWHAFRAQGMGLAKSKVEAGLDPVSGYLEWYALQLTLDYPEELYDGLLDNILNLMAKYDPDFRKFPGDPSDLRAHKVWQRNEMLYTGDLEGALMLQRQIEALDAARPRQPAPDAVPLDRLIDVEREAERLNLAPPAQADDAAAPPAPEPLDQDQWEAVRQGIPPEVADDAPAAPTAPAAPAPPPPPPPPIEERRVYFADGTVPGGGDDVAPYLGNAADGSSTAVPTGDALAPHGNLFGGSGTPAAPETVLVPNPPGEELSAYMNLDLDQLRSNYPSVRDAFERWARETSRTEGAYDLAGLDDSVQRLFAAWRAREGAGGAPEGADLDGMHASLLAMLRSYDGQRRPPPTFAADADASQLNAWLALNRADADLRRFARGFEGVLREKQPKGFNLLTDLDDITKVRAGLLQAARDSDDPEEILSLHAMVQLIEDHMYRTMTAAMNRSDIAAATRDPALPNRMYEAYAARELEARLLRTLPEGAVPGPEDPYPYALALALKDLQGGVTDPRARLDAQISFLEAQLLDAGGNAARRRELQDQLDGHRQARATLEQVMTKWEMPKELPTTAPPDYNMESSWNLLYDEGADGPQLVSYVPESVATEVQDVSRRYADLLGDDLGDIDPSDPVQVRDRISQLHQESLEALDNPAGDVLDADPFRANRYQQMLDTMDRDTYRVLEQEGLTNTIDSDAIQSRFPHLSAEFDDFATSTDPTGPGWTEAGVDAGRIDAFEAWQAQRDPLGAAGGRVSQFARFLRHQRRSHMTRLMGLPA